MNTRAVARVCAPLCSLVIGLGLGQVAWGNSVGLTNGASTLTVNTHGAAGDEHGIISWTINGRELVGTRGLWFGYRVGSAGVVTPVDTIGGVADQVDTDNTHLRSTYTTTNFNITIDYTLSSNGLSIQPAVANLASSAYSLELFAFFDYNVSPVGQDKARIPSKYNAYVVDANSTAQIQTGISGFSYAALPYPTWQAAAASTLFNSITGTSGYALDKTPLNGSYTSVGDVAWAFDWGRSFSTPNQTLSGSLAVTPTLPAPLPAAVLPGLLMLAGLGGAKLARMRRRPA